MAQRFIVRNHGFTKIIEPVKRTIQPTSTHINRPFHGLRIHSHSDPSDKSLGYFQSSASRTEPSRLFVLSSPSVSTLLHVSCAEQREIKQVKQSHYIETERGYLFRHCATPSLQVIVQK